MMSAKLKVEMFRYGTLVFGRVLKMNEGMRGVGTLGSTYQDGVDFKLASVNSPELKAHELFVRGYREEEDDKVFQHNYPDEEKASSACEAFKRLVDTVNAADRVNAADIERVMP